MRKTTLIIIGGIIVIIGALSLTKTGKSLIMSGLKSISDAGLNFLKGVERFSSKAYWDVKGWSIGFGHFMGANKVEDNITLDRALELLRNDLRWAENAVNGYVKVSLTQGQFDALVSFVYNFGAPAFKGSTLLKKLNAGDYIGAYHEFPKWNQTRVDGILQKSQSLVDRREKEQQLFMS